MLIVRALIDEHNIRLDCVGPRRKFTADGRPLRRLQNTSINESREPAPHCQPSGLPRADRQAPRLPSLSITSDRVSTEVGHALFPRRLHLLLPRVKGDLRCISLQSCLYFARFRRNIRRKTDFIDHPENPLAERHSYRKLVEQAVLAKKRAHAPYSHFRVGAALLTSGGQVYTGCNIEISTYALTICAERTAIFKAMSEGQTKFKAIAVVSDDPGFTPPCGACRQVLMDLAGNIDFVMVTGRGATKVLKLNSLLPHAFGQKNLERTKKRRH